MSTYVLGLTILHNFGPFAHAEINFSLPGLSMIEGQIEDMMGCDSNGSGKSFLLDAAPWVLFDRCMREKYHGDEVIRLKWEGGHWVPRNDGEGTWCEVHLTNGVKKMRVRKYRGDPEFKNKKFLWIDGKDVTRGIDAQTTAAIEHELGMDFTLFCNGPAFGVREDVRSFFNATDSDRKRILVKLLGLELYDEAYKVAQAELKLLAPFLTTYETQRVELSAQITERQAAIDAQANSEVVEDHEHKLLVQRLHMKAARDSLKKAMKAREEAEVDVLVEKVKVDELNSIHDEIEKAWELHLTHLKAEEQTIRGERDTASGAASSFTAQKAKWNNLKGKACPSCEQTLDAETADAALARLDASIAEAHTNIAFANAKLKAKIEEREAHEADPPVEPEHLLYVALCDVAEATRIDKDLCANNINIEHGKLELLEAHTQDFTSQAKELEAKLAESKAALAKAEAGWGEMRRKADLLTFWIEGFGNAGVKSLLIEAELPEISKRATGHLQGLLCEGSKIILCATKDLKTKAVTKEELTIELTIPRCTKSFYGASKGQKHRANLSMVLACRDLLGSRSAKAFKQLFADELFDGLDKTGCRFIIDMLKGIAKNVPVCLVTHDANLKKGADRVYVVQWQKGVAHLLAHSALGDTVAPVSPTKGSNHGGRKGKG